MQTSPDTFRERALSVFPAGSNGEYGIPADLIPVIRSGKGCRVADADGREFLDMTMAWGAALVGHAHPKVIEAVMKQAALGANFAAVNCRAVELAERLRSINPALERVRFVASGTEATMLCLRVAIAATGRRRILRFEGAYHGQHPIGVAGMIHGKHVTLPGCDSSGAGAPWVESDVLVAPFNDAAGTEAILRAHATEIAAVIVEPLHRCLPPAPGFLQSLRSLTRELGVALIFDEVVTGFRLALGGACEFYGVTPDLIAYGKALGGGFPIGAYGGRADLMEVVEESRLPGPRYVWSASTSGGNPVSCAAAIAALEIFAGEGVYPALRARGELLRTGMREVLRAAEEPAQALGEGPLAQVAFSAAPVTNNQQWLASDRAKGRDLMLQLLRQGVFLNPMGTKLYLSLAHGEAEIEAFCDQLARALTVIQRAGAH
ncbi:MAG: aminotransferase class III-fold pyridoxal phosphate-dependent enzyme [Verrucomicrobia bacterium]|nr:aminotransferase class III-fold pyridoxal phosphate-dependent enzyme [Verrucomicrobiota bacterium]MBI3871435.1 aminotransferase class III-fold pyridoxal phosphate-dependent enzyme [Verrucomicrobiota bacterium]